MQNWSKSFIHALLLIVFVILSSSFIMHQLEPDTFPRWLDALWWTAQAAIHPGSSTLFKQLLSKTEGENLYEIKKKPHWHTYRDAAMELFESGATLISDGNSLDIARRSNDPILENAKLYIICDEPTYRKIVSS